MPGELRKPSQLASDHLAPGRPQSTEVAAQHIGMQIVGAEHKLVVVDRLEVVGMRLEVAGTPFEAAGRRLEVGRIALVRVEVLDTLRRESAQELVRRAERGPVHNSREDIQRKVGRNDRQLSPAESRWARYCIPTAFVKLRLVERQ